MQKAKRVLIMGLPGSGKTTLAKNVVKFLKADWLNADKIRGKHNDWDFTKAGILRQVKRMNSLANKSKKNFVVADFVCPINKQRLIFKPDYIIWMDTINKSRFQSMNRIFTRPKKYNLRLTKKMLKFNLKKTRIKLMNFFKK